MNLRNLLAPLAALAIAVVAMPTASADDDERAYIKVKNDSTWKVDCRVFWGSQSIPFNGVEPSATSESKQIPVSPTERTLVCKKTGAQPVPANVSAPIKFKAENIAKYTINCAHKDNGAGLTCSVSQ